jgi:hypothetical protein
MAEEACEKRSLTDSGTGQGRSCILTNVLLSIKVPPK